MRHFDNDAIITGNTIVILLDRFDHGKAHVHAKHGVIGPFPGSAADTIITIA